MLALSELRQHGLYLEKTSGASPGVVVCTEKEYLAMGKGSGGI